MAVKMDPNQGISGIRPTGRSELIDVPFETALRNGKITLDGPILTVSGSKETFLVDLHGNTPVVNSTSTSSLTPLNTKQLEALRARLNDIKPSGGFTPEAKYADAQLANWKSLLAGEPVKVFDAREMWALSQRFVSRPIQRSEDPMKRELPLELLHELDRHEISERQLGATRAEVKGVFQQLGARDARILLSYVTSGSATGRAALDTLSNIASAIRRGEATYADLGLTANGFSNLLKTAQRQAEDEAAHAPRPR